MSELPESWIKTSLGQAVNYAENETVDPADMPLTAWLLELEDIERDTGNVLERRTVGEREPKSSKNRFHAGDVLYGKLRPYLNKVVRADQDGFCSSEIIAIPPGVLDQNYLFYSMRSPEFIEYVSSVSHGMRMPRLGTQQAKSAPFVLPPLAEQTRIAQKLDELLAQVDTLKARIDAIPALLKHFRQSVLAAAVSGQLTEEWRAQNTDTPPLSAQLEKSPLFLPAGYKRLSKQKFKIVNREFTPPALPGSWEVHSIADLYEKKALIDFADGNHGSLYPRSEEFGDAGAIFLTATQIDDNWHVSLDDCPLLNREKANQLTKGWAVSGDVLLTHNATVGRVGILVASEPVILGTSVTFYRFHEDAIDRGYARALFSSHFFQEQLEGAMEQTTRNQVPITAQVSLKFICPPIAEQRVISRQVEQLFAFADQLEAKVATAQARIDRLTQSILAKAFRGELVPQDPNDEPASLLLERIQAQRATAPKAKRGRKASA